jgi:hypothetical protein
MLAGGLSPYETMGQGGNVWEWTETEWDLTNNSTSSLHAIRGGRYNGESSQLDAGGRNSFDPADTVVRIGFRVASLFAIPVDLESDFNSDERIDGDDFLIWETYFGVVDPFGHDVHEFGDADEDSDIDGNDFLIWQSEFGNTIAVAVTTAIIPEPTTILLAMLGMASTCCIRRRR